MVSYMIKAFENLNESEVDLMLRAPVVVCILIAGADGNIDRKEIREAIVQTKRKNKPALTDYLTEVSQDFEDKLKILIQSYPHSSAERNPVIIHELTKLNDLWARIDSAFANSFYELLRELAAKIAGSSGGLWGMKSVDSEEARLLELPMIKRPA
jgi:hypothetical protein